MSSYRSENTQMKDVFFGIAIGLVVGYGLRYWYVDAGIQWLLS